MDSRRIGLQIRRDLAAAGMSQRELAESLNVDAATVSRLCRGLPERPNLELLLRTADALGVSLDHLLGREVADTPSQSASLDEPHAMPRDWRELAMRLAGAEERRAEAELARARAEEKRADAELERVQRLAPEMHRTIQEIVQMAREERGLGTGSELAVTAPHPASRTGSAAG